MACHYITDIEPKLHKYQALLDDFTARQENGTLDKDVEAFIAQLRDLQIAEYNLAKLTIGTLIHLPASVSGWDIASVVRDLTSDSCLKALSEFGENLDNETEIAHALLRHISELNNALDEKRAIVQMKTNAYKAKVAAQQFDLHVETQRLRSSPIGKAILERDTKARMPSDCDYKDAPNGLAYEILVHHALKVDKCIWRMQPAIRAYTGLSAYHSKLECLPSARPDVSGVLTSPAPMSELIYGLGWPEHIAPTIRKFLWHPRLTCIAPTAEVLAWLFDYTTSVDQWYDYLLDLEADLDGGLFFVVPLRDNNSTREKTHFTTTDIAEMRKQEEIMWCAYETVILRAVYWERGVEYSVDVRCAQPKRGFDEIEASVKRQAK